MLPLEYKLNIFIPVYFDVSSLLILLENIEAILPEGAEPYFHVIDDSAGTDSRMKNLVGMKNVSIIPTPFNLGHQRALVYALRKFLSKEKCPSLIITMDGDGEDRPEDILRLLDQLKLENSQNSLILAKRTQRKESFTFRFFYYFYKRFFHLLTGTIIQSGNFALYNASTIRRIIFHPYFEMAYASSLLSVGSNIVFVPCPKGNRYEGQSKMNFLRLVIHGIKMLMPFMDRIAVRGVIVFSATFGLSVVCCFALIGIHVFSLYVVPSWILMGSVLFFILSFLSVCNFAILMTIFVNVQGLAMTRLEVDPIDEA